jgi:immune inhibitor A
MKAKWFSIFLIVVMLVISFVPEVGAAPKPIDYRPASISDEVRNWDPTSEHLLPIDQAALADEVAAAEVVAAASTTDCILDAKTFLGLDDTSGYFFDTFYLMAESDNSQIWVQAFLDWPAGDPRPTPVVDCDQAAYMMGEFDNNMYPVETNFFGTPDFHDGSFSLLEEWGYVPEGYYDDALGRQIVLVENVEDENYYDPTYPIYIAGFYSDTLEAYFDRNAMTIDAYDWLNRTGPNGTRPYLYEGVFAHEYQHLLHSDYDGDEENFINEGMSDLAMVLTGYGEAVTGHQEPAADFPENSLTVWGDQGDLEILTDYGQAFLFQYYLMEQYGPSFIQALFHNPDNGITGVDSTLAAFNSHRDFAEVFHDWSIAMLIDSKKPADSRYQFKDFDFNLNIGTPSAPNLEAFSTPGAPPWGTDYLWITGTPKDLRRLTFNGLPYSTFPTAWSSDGSVLYSGTGDLIDNWAIFETVGGGSLTFDTKYDFEQYWDFGFVQVSTDGGYTWTSLANASTTDLHDTSAHPTVIANLPGLTGTQATLVNMSYDLSAYAGQNILVAFRYVTDWATSGAGWYVDNVTVNGTLISDGSSVAPFKDITEIIPVNNDYAVTFVGTKGSGRKIEYKIKVMHLNDITESGKIELNDLLKWSNSVVMMVSFNAPEGITYYADYTYQLEYKHSKPKSHKPVHGHGNGTHFDNHRHH